MTNTCQTIPAVVGANAKRMRVDSGSTLDAVATRAQIYGLKWSTARVVELERGRLAVGIHTLVLLAQVMGDITGNRVAIGDLLASDSWIELTPSVAVSSRWLQGTAAGVPVALRPSDTEKGLQPIYDGLLDVAQSDPLSAELPPDLGFEELERVAEMPRGIAEERAARILGISPLAVNAYALTLWGKSLSEKRDEASADASAQARGHRTRALVSELRRRIDRDKQDATGDTHAN